MAPRRGAKSLLFDSVNSNPLDGNVDGMIVSKSSASMVASPS